MLGTSKVRALTFVGVAIATAALTAACGTSSSSSSSSSGSSGGGKNIALLLPETKTTRYEQQDKPLFEAKVKALCPDCTIQYFNANQDPATQQTQADSALTNGANVLVLDPVDGKAAAAIVNKANAANVPVISYDRLLLNSKPTLYISFDNEQVGKLQATSLTTKLTAMGNPTGPIVMINGSPTDNNATLFKKGAMSVFAAKGVKIAASYDTPDWSPDKAQTWMDQTITKLGKNGFVGVYAANDGTAGGAIAAMKNAGIDVTKVPSTGQDAELAAIQRILVDQQYMTVYKAIKLEAEQAAQSAVDQAQGKTASTTATVNNGMMDVPSILLTPVEVTKDNINSTIVKDGFYTPAQICTPAYAAACTAAGITP